MRHQDDESTRTLVRIVFSLRHWTPKKAREWVASRGYSAVGAQTNDHVCVVHIKPPNSYTLRSLDIVKTQTAGVMFGTACMKPLNMPVRAPKSRYSARNVA